MYRFLSSVLAVLCMLAGILSLWGCGIVVFCAATNDFSGVFGGAVIALIAGVVSFGSLVGSRTLKTMDKVDQHMDAQRRSFL